MKRQKGDIQKKKKRKKETVDFKQQI